MSGDTYCFFQPLNASEHTRSVHVEALECVIDALEVSIGFCEFLRRSVLKFIHVFSHINETGFKMVYPTLQGVSHSLHVLQEDSVRNAGCFGVLVSHEGGKCSTSFSFGRSSSILFRVTWGISLSSSEKMSSSGGKNAQEYSATSHRS